MAAAAIATILLSISIYSMFTPFTYDICNKNEYTGQKECAPYHVAPYIIVEIGAFLDTYNGVITAIATIAIACFTWTLYRSSERMWKITNISAKAARRSANAAKSAAHALPIIERAYVYPIIDSPGTLQQCIIDATAFYLGDPQTIDNPCDSTTCITFRIKNYGKTPAILKTVYAGVGLCPSKAGIVIADGILGSGNETRSLKSAMKRGLTRNEAKSVLALSKRVAFTGEIVFQDIWGANHRTEFHFAWDVNENKMQLCGLKTSVIPPGQLII